MSGLMLGGNLEVGTGNPENSNPQELAETPERT